VRNKSYKDTLFNVVDYLSTVVIFLITTKLFIGQLGTDGYGFYTFFTSLIGTFGLVDIGMGMAVSKYLSEYLHQNKINESNQVITQAILFYLVVGLLIVTVVNFFSTPLMLLFGFGEKFYELGKLVLFIISIVFMLNLFISIGTNVLVALEKWQGIATMNIGIKMLNAFLLVKILLLDISYSKKIEFVFYTILVFSTLKLVLYSWLAYRQYPSFKWQKPDKIIRQKIVSFLKWSSLQYGLSMLVGQADKIVISRFFGLETLGLYNFVVSAFTYMYGFVASVFRIYFPKFSKMHADQDYGKLKVNFRKLILWSMGLSMILGAISIACWKPFVTSYIDARFANDTFYYFIIFTIFLIVRSPEIIFSYFFNATAKPSILVKNLSIGAAVTVISYFILIPNFNAYGLVLSQIAGSLVVYSFTYYQINKEGFNCYVTKP
jgi:O-antigen/teichoic acid export membrane protein